MTTFAYRAFDKGGQVSKGDIDAASPASAGSLLRQRGLTPIEISEHQDGRRQWWRYESASAGHPKAAETAALIRDLSLLVQAEIPLDRALKLLVEEAPLRLRRVADRLFLKVLDGSSLSDAAALQPNIFSREVVNSIKAGEVSGKLGIALARLAELLKAREERSAKLRTALVYPLLLLGMGLAATIIVLVVLVPSIAPIFKDSGQPLPTGLSWLMTIGNAWPLWGCALAISALTILLWRRSMTRHPERGIPLQAALLRVPLLNQFIQQNDAARFARTLSTLLGAGVPLLTSLATALESMTNGALRKKLAGIVDDVRNGANLGEAVGRTDAMPRLLVQMLSIGEEAGKPQVMLAQVADLYERQSQERIERMMSVLTPVLTIAIAGLVGGLIFSVMSAVLAINDLAIGR